MTQLITQSMLVFVLGYDVVSIRRVVLIAQLFQFRLRGEALVHVLVQQLTQD